MIWRHVFGGFMGIGSAAVLFFLTRINNWWQFLLIWIGWLFVLWALGLYFNASRPRGMGHDLPLAISGAVAVTILLTLVEDDLWRKSLVAFAGSVMFFLFSQIARRKSELSYEEKPYRRIRMMLWVFAAYSVLTLVYAIGSFFQAVPFWIVALAGSAIVGAISLLIWKMYFAVGWRSLVMWAALIGLAVLEIIWAQNFLPFGYLVLGAFTAWIWYLMQLFIRFHLSQQGIVWRKQVYFLATNLVLYVLMMWMFVRWI